MPTNKTLDRPLDKCPNTPAGLTTVGASDAKRHLTRASARNATVGFRRMLDGTGRGARAGPILFSF